MIAIAITYISRKICIFFKYFYILFDLFLHTQNCVKQIENE